MVFTTSWRPPAIPIAIVATSALRIIGSPLTDFVRNLSPKSRFQKPARQGWSRCYVSQLLRHNKLAGQNQMIVDSGSTRRLKTPARYASRGDKVVLAQLAN